MNQRDADPLKRLFVNALDAVRLRILEHVDGQLRRDGHARVDVFHLVADLQRNRLRAAALGQRAVYGGIPTVLGERPFAVQLEEHAVFARVERVKAVSAVFIRPGLRDAFGMAVLDAQQHNAQIGNGLRALRNHAVAVVVDAHRAGNGGALAHRHRAEIHNVALRQLHRAANLAVLRVRGEIALRQRQHNVVFARQHPREIKRAAVARHHHGRLLFAALFHFEVQPAETDRLPVRKLLKHIAVDLARVNAARVDDIIAVVAVNHEGFAQAVMRVAHSALHVVGIQLAAGEDHAASPVKLHGIAAAGDGRKRIASVRIGAAGADNLARPREQRHVQPRVARGFVRVHHAVGVAVQKRNAADRAVHARGGRRKHAAARHAEAVRPFRSARNRLLRAVRLRLHKQRPVEGRPRVQRRRALHARFHVQRDLPRRKAALGQLLAGLRIQISDAHRVDIVGHIRKAHGRRPCEHVGRLGLGGPPAAARQAVFHARAIAAAVFIRRRGEHEALNLHPRAALLRYVDLYARLNQCLAPAHGGGIHRQQGQPLRVGGVYIVEQPFDRPAFRQRQAAHARARHASALRQIRRNLHRDLAVFAERIAFGRLDLAQRVGADGHGHRVAICRVAHFKIEHRLAVAAQQFKPPAEDMRPGGYIRQIQLKEAPVAGNRAIQYARLARGQRDFVDRLVRRESGRAAQFAQIIRRALRLGREPDADGLLFARRGVGPHRRLLRRGGIRRQAAVFHRIHAVFARQRHDVGLQLVVERQTRFRDGQQRVFLQRNAHALHLAARNGHGLLAGKRVALGHLRLSEHIGARRKLTRVERAVRQRQIGRLPVGSQQLKAHLRHLLLFERPARQRHAHAAERVHARQRHIGLLRVLHGKARRLRRGHALRESLRLRGVFAGRKADGTHAVRVGLQQNAGVVHALPAALHAVNPHLRAGKRLLGGVSVRIQLAHRNGELRQPVTRVHEADFPGLARNGSARRLRRAVIALRRALRRNRRFARGHRRRHRAPRFVRRHGIALTGRIRHVIRRSGNRVAVFIDAVQHQPRLRRRKGDRLLAAGQRERLGLRQNAQPRRVAFRQPQHIGSAQRLQRNAAILNLHVVRRLPPAVCRQQFGCQRPIQRRFLPRARVVDLRAHHRKALIFEREQAHRNLRGLSRFNADRLVIRFAELGVFRRGDFLHAVNARRKRVGNRQPVRVHRIRAVDLARLLGGIADRAAGYRAPALGLHHNAPHAARRRQLDLRGLAAAHDQLPLREGQKDIRIPRIGERHVVAALRQRRLRHAVAVRRHVALTGNVQRQTGERLFLPLAQRVDGYHRRRRLHRARRGMLKDDAHGGCKRHLRACAVVLRRKNALRQLGFRNGVVSLAVAEQHRLSVSIGRQFRLRARLVRCRQANAFDRLAPLVAHRDVQPPLRLVLNDDFAVRHRDQRLAVERVALRRALLSQVKLRALRQAEARFGFARADAHRLAGQQRICPRRELSLAGIDVHAEFRARQRLHGLLFAVFAALHALNAQADGAHAGRV